MAAAIKTSSGSNSVPRGMAIDKSRTRLAVRQNVDLSDRVAAKVGFVWFNTPPTKLDVMRSFGLRFLATVLRGLINFTDCPLVAILKSKVVLLIDSRYVTAGSVGEFRDRSLAGCASFAAPR